MERGSLDHFQDGIHKSVNEFVYDWRPSWEALLTKEEIAQELDIEYTTFGWYRAGTDMLLILPVQGKPEEKQQYRVCRFIDRDPRVTFKKIGEMHCVGRKKGERY